MTRTTLLPDFLFDGETLHQNTPVTFEGDRIVALDSVPTVPVQRVSGTLVPGFIDLQLNGGGGVLFNTSPTVFGLQQIGSAHARFGTTSWLPTLITDRIEVMQRAADTVAHAIAQNMPGIIGVHFEGPHLSTNKRGVHASELIRPLNDAEWQVLSRQDLGKVVVTLAPETVSVDDLRRLVSVGVTVCLGHSNADAITTQNAIAAGARGFTHLFNAMSPFASREPGMVGVALHDEQTWCGIIVDGVHVHPLSLQVALRVKPRGKVFLVTDAMPTVGTQNETFEFFGASVKRLGNTLFDNSGALAGSHLDMASAVRNSVALLHLDRTEAWRMASRYPAEFIGVQKHFGRIELGCSADFVLLDDHLNVRDCWQRGMKV